jgi:hypothetical protein
VFSSSGLRPTSVANLNPTWSQAIRKRACYGVQSLNLLSHRPALTLSLLAALSKCSLPGQGYRLTLCFRRVLTQGPLTGAGAIGAEGLSQYLGCNTAQLTCDLDVSGQRPRCELYDTLRHHCISQRYVASQARPGCSVSVARCVLCVLTVATRLPTSFDSENCYNLYLPQLAHDCKVRAGIPHFPVPAQATNQYCCELPCSGLLGPANQCAARHDGPAWRSGLGLSAQLSERTIANSCEKCEV